MGYFNKTISIILGFLLLSQSAFAEEKSDDQFQMGLSLGLTVPIGQDRFKTQVGSNLAGGINFAYFFWEVFGFQIAYDRLEFASSPISVDAFQASLLFRPHTGSSFRPIIGIGAGADSAKLLLSSPRSYSNFAMNAQLAGQFQLGAATYLTAGLKYHYVTNSTTAPTEIHVLVPFLGFSFSFGDRSNAPQEDNYVAKDDADFDGVKDYVDQCPNTPKGEQVNEFGCAVQETVEFKINIQFPSGQSTIPTVYEGEIEKIAQFLKKYPDTKSTIEGHTDNIGNAESNQKLSQSRADSVRDYLIQKHDILPQRLDAIGYGSERPIATNTTAEGRRENRRVIAVIHTDR